MRRRSAAGGSPVGRRPAAPLAGERPGPSRGRSGVVGTDHPGPGAAGDEAVEGARMAASMPRSVEVVRLDAGDHHRLAGQGSRKVPSLSSASTTIHSPSRPTDGAPAAQPGDVAADDPRGSPSGVDEDHRQHRRGGGLAVGAGDRERIRRAAQIAARIAARLATAIPARRAADDLGVVGGHGGGHGHQVGAGDQGRVVAGAARRCPRGQAVEHGRRPQVAAGHLVAHGGQHGGDGAHAGAPDADHVDPPGPVEGPADRLRQARACFSARAATPAAASGRARPWAASPMAREAVGVGQQRVDHGGQSGAVQVSRRR